MLKKDRTFILYKNTTLSNHIVTKQVKTINKILKVINLQGDERARWLGCKTDGLVVLEVWDYSFNLLRLKNSIKFCLDGILIYEFIQILEEEIESQSGKVFIIWDLQKVAIMVCGVSAYCTCWIYFIHICYPQILLGTQYQANNHLENKSWSVQVGILKIF